MEKWPADAADNRAAKRCWPPPTVYAPSRAARLPHSAHIALLATACHCHMCAVAKADGCWFLPNRTIACLFLANPAAAMLKCIARLQRNVVVAAAAAVASGMQGMGQCVFNLLTKRRFSAFSTSFRVYFLLLLSLLLS